MTEEKDDISRLVSERVTALCFNEGDAADRERWRDIARTAYDLRSRLVHGSISPRALEVWRGVRLGGELGQALLSAAHAFDISGLRLTKISAKRLGRSFAEVIANADREIAAASSTADEAEPVSA